MPPRSREMVGLPERIAQGVERLEPSRGLDPLGDHNRVELLRERDEAAGERAAPAGAFDSAGQRAVELDERRRELQRVAQAAAASASELVLLEPGGSFSEQS